MKKTLGKIIKSGIAGASMLSLGACVTTGSNESYVDVSNLENLSYAISTPSGEVRKSFKEVNPEFESSGIGSAFNAPFEVYLPNQPTSFRKLVDKLKSNYNHDSVLRSKETNDLVVKALGTLEHSDYTGIDLYFDGKKVEGGIDLGSYKDKVGLGKLLEDYELKYSNTPVGEFLKSLKQVIDSGNGGSSGGSSSSGSSGGSSSGSSGGSGGGSGSGGM